MWCIQAVCVKVAFGPKKATLSGSSRERDADMISLKITLSATSGKGPALAARTFFITSRSRLGT